jgi:ABC-type multidrug transport system fused ATPase/permease subunit
MFKLIKELFSVLTSEQRRKFYILQLLVVMMAFSEIIGVASIGPFMAVIGDMGILQDDNAIAYFYRISGVNDPADFLFLMGLGVLVLLGSATALSSFTVWRLSIFSAKTGMEIATRLYTHYMRQSWLFHATGSSAQLTKQVASEALRLSDNVIQPLMLMNSRIVLSLFIIIAIFIFNPLVAVMGLIIFSTAYLIIFSIVQKRLQYNGKIISISSTVRFRLMNEGFGGIKDIILLGRNDDFIKRFKKESEDFAYARGTNNALIIMPRYFMEFFAFGAMIGLVLILLKTQQGDLGVVLPMIAIYALAGYKLLPALQQIYSSLAHIKGNLVAFESIKSDLFDSCYNEDRHSLNSSTEHITFNNFIQLENITFTYPGKNQPTLNQINLTIPANQVIGIVGPSGAGKSTVVDIILGLVQAQKGDLKIDDTPLDDGNRRAWQNSIGFVPQSIFLSEGTIAENVAFGISSDKIDLKSVKKTIKLAHLDEMVNQLPEGIHTKVGERGVQLSGGQRQRIGIARSLYNEAKILVFDEATSALDGITENIIMDAIHDFSGKKTIIMIAHRLKTVQKCDIIFIIDEGKLIDQGTYFELIKKNDYFKRMAEYA